MIQGMIYDLYTPVLKFENIYMLSIKNRKLFNEKKQTNKHYFNPT